jgi:hypothetical protein
MAYLGSASSVSIKLDKIRSAGQANAFWVDPRTGKQESIGKLATDGVHSFSTPDGWEDAVLVLEKSDR